MFEKMIVSSVKRSGRRMAKYMIGAFLLYGLVLAAALALSVVLADPRLVMAETGTKVFSFLPAPRQGGSAPVRAAVRPATAPNPYHVLPLQLLLRHPDHVVTPTPPIFRSDFETDKPGVGGPSGPGCQGCPAIGTGSGTGDRLSDGLATDAGPAAPLPRTPKPASQALPKERPTLRMSPAILQGKAIERKIPDYPQLARNIHLEGQVVVEVLISPEGRVESAHAVSGHPLLTKAATDAAWGWRFQPTMLGDMPVRVTGVLTFVFKF